MKSVTQSPGMKTQGLAALGPASLLAPYEFMRRPVGLQDILIQILYCGVCHSDVHQVRGEWANSIYPMVPGHEIVGRVLQVGAGVKKFQVGDLAGVGCFVDSCRKCSSCQEGLEQYCSEHLVGTYNSTEKDLITPTYGGYSERIVVDQHYALQIPAGLPLAQVAPLLCAGITTYSPLKHWKIGSGHKIAIVGMGGLGHMAVQFAKALGAHVTVLSSSSAKEEDARKFGADAFAVTSVPETFVSLRSRFDWILDTVSGPHDLNLYLNLLKTGSTLVLLGAPEVPPAVQPFALIAHRKTLAGSMIGGIHETQEMLSFCAEKQILPEIEMISIQAIHTAYERMLRGDVRYRFVIDLETLSGEGKTLS